MRAIILALVLVSSATAFADSAPVLDYLPPACALSVRHDSYGVGLYWGVRGDLGARPATADELCFNLGAQRGEQLRAEGCEVEELHSGFSAGWLVTSAAGTACFNAGAAAGQAWLNFGARGASIGQAPEACVELYARGQADARASRPAEVSGSWSTQETHCYLLGHFEG